MKNRLSILVVAVSLTILVVIASFFSVSAKYSNESKLLLKEYNGSVALYKGDKIIEIYDEIVISVLPDADREILKKGIVIDNEEQLNRIIEDYDG